MFSKPSSAVQPWQKAAVVSAVAFGFLGVNSVSAHAATNLQTLSATEDSYVVENSPDINYGTRQRLQTDGSTGAADARLSYLKFTVSGVTESVVSAKLRVYAESGNSVGYEVRQSADTWSENGLTYRNRPAPGNVVGRSGSYASGQWTTVDVTSVVRGNGTFSFALSALNTSMTTLSSREAAANRPQLVLATALVEAGRPVRAAFYYPWFPETWGSPSDPFTNYHPSMNLYSSDDASVISRHVAAMRYAHLDAGISSWWGQGEHRESTRFPAQLNAASGTGFKWALYYEKEGFAHPGVAELSGDLSYIRARYAGNPNYLTVDGKPVIYVYGDANDDCGMADRWKEANTFGFHVVLKVFGGYANCASQPGDWHQYAPANAQDRQVGHSFAVSPGLWLKGESVRLSRDPARFAQSVSDMVASNEPQQLLTTFNEWGEGTALESATEWASSSGYGTYLDILHNTIPAPSASA